MTKQISVLVLSLMFFAGCATVAIQKEKLSPEQKTYVSEMEKAPLEFDLTKEEAVDAWGRAQSFIAKYSSMKLQISTDFSIQTYNPPDPAVTGNLGDINKFGYSVTKTPIKDKLQISVQCIFGGSGGGVVGVNANNNARILAYYIATGKLPYPEMISK